MQWEIDKHVERLADANSFYRSKGCRDLVAIGRADQLLKSELGNTWHFLHEALMRLLKKETDEDVLRFANEAMELMGAPRTVSRACIFLRYCAGAWCKTRLCSAGRWLVGSG